MQRITCSYDIGWYSTADVWFDIIDGAHSVDVYSSPLKTTYTCIQYVFPQTAVSRKPYRAGLFDTGPQVVRKYPNTFPRTIYQQHTTNHF